MVCHDYVDLALALCEEGGIRGIFAMAGVEVREDSLVESASSRG